MDKTRGRVWLKRGRPNGQLCGEADSAHSAHVALLQRSSRSGVQLSSRPGSLRKRVGALAAARAPPNSDHRDWPPPKTAFQIPSYPTLANPTASSTTHLTTTLSSSKRPFFACSTLYFSFRALPAMLGRTAL